MFYHHSNEFIKKHLQLFCYPTPKGAGITMLFICKAVGSFRGGRSYYHHRHPRHVLVDLQLYRPAPFGPLVLMATIDFSNEEQLARCIGVYLRTHSHPCSQYVAIWRLGQSAVQLWVWQVNINRNLAESSLILATLLPPPTHTKFHYQPSFTIIIFWVCTHFF